MHTTLAHVCCQPCETDFQKMIQPAQISAQSAVKLGGADHSSIKRPTNSPHHKLDQVRLDSQLIQYLYWQAHHNPPRRLQHASPKECRSGGWQHILPHRAVGVALPKRIIFRHL